MTPPAPLRLLLLLALAGPACAGDEAADPDALAPPATLAVDALENGGFEWIADGTTSPPKYGAYWLGAFVAEPDDPTDLVVDHVAHGGARSLRLGAGDAVLQKLVADERWSDATHVRLAVRVPDGAGLDVTLEDGPGQTVTLAITGGADGPTVVWRNVDGAPGAHARRLPTASRGEAGWWRVDAPLGGAFVAAHGRAPTPRLNLHLAQAGEGAVHVDDVVARLAWPAATRAELLARARELVTWQLELWWLSREDGGLGLVDPTTGYVRAGRYDVTTGAAEPTERFGHLHTVHTLLLQWLELARAHGWSDETDRWTPALERVVQTLLEHNIDPRTQLPRSVERADLAPRRDAPVTVGSYLSFLVDASEVIADERLAQRCRDQARKTADALVWLARAHDKPPREVNHLTLDRTTGVLEGDVDNWFGHMPPKLAPTGEIDQPRRFNSAWAIATGRPFWYHLLKTPAAIAKVHSVAPRPGDVAAIRKAVSLYERDWDAARYDLENDTDDHYGYHAEDVVDILAYLPPGAVPGALASLHEATEHRLSRESGTIDDMLWIQAVRLGTACAGDSPRAFQGVAAFAALDAERNPRSSGDHLYRDAILELARNDLKGRQLTNGQFTESFFADWEMVCICFRGTYQGDCREHPADWWHGDVGDTFGGPPTTGLEAQALAFAVAPLERRQEFAAALALVDEVTQRTMRREYGFLFGLDEAIARQYELPEKYTIGVSDDEPAALAYAMSWLRCARDLLSVDAAPPPAPRIERAARGVVVTGPAGATVAVLGWPRALLGPARAAPDDRRVLAGDATLSERVVVVLDADGRAALVEPPGDVVQPIVLEPAGTRVVSIGAPTAVFER